MSSLSDAEKQEVIRYLEAPHADLMEWTAR